MADQIPTEKANQPQVVQKQPEVPSPQKKEGENIFSRKWPTFLKIIFPSFIILTLVACGILGFLYYKQREELNSQKSNNDSLTAQVSSLQQQLVDASKSSSEYQDQIDKLESDLEAERNDNTDLTADKEALQAEVDGYEQKQAKIKAYNDFLNYMYFLINTKGFDGYTQAEYNTAIAKAQATGDNGLVDAVEALSTAPVGERVDEFAAVINEVITGINGNL